MKIQDAIRELVEGKNLRIEQMEKVTHEIMLGKTSEAAIGGFLVALKMKGETIDEIVGAAETMAKLVEPVNTDTRCLVDICGTGGSGSNKFNVSTASAFVASAAGTKIAKHGNRSASSNSGSADVLEIAGANIMLSPDQVSLCIDKLGIGFMFAVNHHSAMRHVSIPRKQLKIRTIFNLLGPLTNPARVKRQLLGVYDKKLVLPMAEVLSRLGSEHAMVVHSEDGLDEISVYAKTHVAEIRKGSIEEYWLEPGDLDLKGFNFQNLKVESSQQSLELIKRVFRNESEEGKNMVLINSGAAIYLSGMVDSLANGVQLARDVIRSGAAMVKLREFCEFTQQFDSRR
jgi:anthranilate phosphoribosyltransferase